MPFALANQSTLNLAAYLRRYRTSSPFTLFNYLKDVRLFSEWVGRSPDELVSTALDGEGLPDPKGIKGLRSLLEEYVGELRARGHAPNAVKVAVNAVRILLRVNGVDVGRILLPKGGVVYEDRAPRPEELARMMDVADLRGKVIISMLALGGFRIGTLARQKYRHAREDLERGIIPVHIHVEAEITKGKYGSYDTFIGRGT
jgi:hypothetical protein